MMPGVGGVGDQLPEDGADGGPIRYDEQRWRNQGLGRAHAWTVVAGGQRLPPGTSFVSWAAPGCLIIGRSRFPNYFGLEINAMLVLKPTNLRNPRPTSTRQNG